MGTLVNGKHRDFNVDTGGSLLVVEEEVSLETIHTRASEGSVTRGKVVVFEAAYTDKAGRKHEIVVNPDGTAPKT